MLVAPPESLPLAGVLLLLAAVISLLIGSETRAF